MGYGPPNGMDYGIWESLVRLAGNRLGGHEKVWLMGGYGLSQVCVKTETTHFMANRALFGGCHISSSTNDIGVGSSGGDRTTNTIKLKVNIEKAYLINIYT